MADEPSARAVWNVKVLVTLLFVGAYLSLLGFGVWGGAVGYEDALKYMANGMGGGVVGWLLK